MLFESDYVTLLLKTLQWLLTSLKGKAKVFTKARKALLDLLLPSFPDHTALSCLLLSPTVQSAGTARAPRCSSHRPSSCSFLCLQRFPSQYQVLTMTCSNITWTKKLFPSSSDLSPIQSTVPHDILFLSCFSFLFL